VSKIFYSKVIGKVSHIRSSQFTKVFIWDILSKGVDFVLLPIYLKILSQEEYGFYTYLLYIITTASGVIKLGMDTAVSKMFYETNTYNRGKMLFSANSVWFIFFIALCSLCMLTGVDKTLFSYLLNISEYQYLSIRLFVFIFIFFNLIQTSINVFFVIDEKVVVYQKYNLLRILISNGIIIGLLVFFAKGNKAIFRLTLEPLVYLFSFIPLIAIVLKKMIFKIDWMAIKHGLKIGLPMVGSLLVGIVFNISDKYYLQQSQGYDILAIYNLAIFLTLPISLIFSTFQTVWFPKFVQVKSFKKRFEISNRFVINLIFIFLSILLILWIGLNACIFFGIIPKNYLPLIFFFPVIFFSKMAENLVQVYNNFIVVWGKTNFNFLISVIFSALVFLLNYMIIPVFGIWGAVTILLLMSLLRIIIFFLYVRSNIYGTIY